METLLNYIVWNPSETFLFGLRYYSLCWLLGLFGSYLIARWLYKDLRIRTELFEPLFLYCFVGILIGSRLGHCLFYQPDYFLTSVPHFIEMFLPIKFLADGSVRFTGYQGLASHGGTLGLIIALLVYVKKTKVTAWTVLDIVGISTPICAFFIRIGNLMNSEIIGKITDVPWAFIFEQVDPMPRHPGQLYEALAYLLLLFVGFAVYKKRKDKVGTGFFFGLCLTCIFTFRFFIEFLKEVQEDFEEGLMIDMGQILSLPYVILGIVCIVISWGKTYEIDPKLKIQEKKSKETKQNKKS